MDEVVPHNYETPVALRPTAAMLNASLSDLGISLAQETEGKAPSEVQGYLLGLLNTLTYDGIRVQAADIRRALEPAVGQNLGYHIDDEFGALFSHLEPIGLIEAEGIGAVNTRISELLAVAKSDGPKEQQERAIDSINELLYEAIYVFPHLADGIEIQFRPGTEHAAKAFFEKFGYTYGEERARYDDLYAAHEQQRNQVYSTLRPFDNRLVIPLPYAFSTGTHGSAERAALTQSRETLQLTGIPRHGDWRDLTPALGIEIRAPLITSRLSYFSLDEVEHISFVPEVMRFTPYVETIGGSKLADRGNPIEHYLVFRDFRDYRNFRERGKLRTLTDEEWKICQGNLWTPRPFGNLWHEEFRIFRSRKVQKAFMAVVEDLFPQKSRLYELTDVPATREDHHETEALLFAKAFRAERGHKSWKNLQIYEGHAMITRLAAIPVAARSL